VFRRVDCIACRGYLMPESTKRLSNNTECSLSRSDAHDCMSLSLLNVTTARQAQRQQRSPPRWCPGEPDAAPARPRPDGPGT
jgi:hypothetical protein